MSPSITWQKFPRSERAHVGDITADVWRIGGGARYSIMNEHGVYLDGGQCISLDAAKAAVERQIAP